MGRQRVKGSAAGEFWEAERFKEGLRENKLFSLFQETKEIVSFIKGNELL